MMVSPRVHTRIEAGDTLIAMGKLYPHSLIKSFLRKPGILK